MSLDEIREKIDAIDNRLVEALNDRLALMSEVASAKAASGDVTAIIRPGREALILRRLLSDYAGAAPAELVAQIWREIITAACLMQGELSVAVCAPAMSVGYWDLARNHFGSAMPMSLHRSAGTVLRRVTEDPSAIGILPWPEEGEENPWWVGLSTVEAVNTPPQVICKLPFFASESGRFENLRAFVLANVSPEETGEDMTLLMVETNFDTSRASVTGCFDTMGISSQIIATREEEDIGSRYLLLELTAFLRPDDARLVDVSNRLGENLLRMNVVGNYPISIHIPA